MSKSLIRTRAEEDAADLILKRSTMPSPTLPTAPIIEPPSAPSASPSASAAMDSMWSEYEQYLQAAKAAQEAAIDIFPQPAFVVKVSLVNNNRQGQTASRVKKDLLEDDERGDNDSDKLFINVCMDACVDAPSIVKQSNNTLQPSTAIASSDSSPAPATPPPGSLRLPMSVGPLTPCTSRSGSPSVCVDVVIHPSTLAPPLDAAHSQAAYQYAVAQAALIERQSGTAPPVLTPAQQQAVAMRELKRTVAAFALQRIEEKYKLRINAEPEIKFPKAAYKGTLPPPVQRIRRNKDNPLHAMTPQQREEAERKGKVMVQEVWVAQQSKPTAALAADAAAARATHPSKTGTAHTAPVKLATEDSSRNERHMAGEQQSVGTDEKQTKPSASAVEESTTEVEKSTMANGSAAVTPVYTLDVNDKALTLQVQLPGVTSSAGMDATVTSTDIHITTQPNNERPAYQLHVVFPVSVDDERVQAKFNKKKHTITLTIPTAPQSPPLPTPVATAAAAETTESEAVCDTHSAASTEAADATTVDGRRDSADKEGGVGGSAEGDSLGGGCWVVAAVDWAARLGLSNRLIDQSCLSYN